MHVFLEFMLVLVRIFLSYVKVLYQFVVPPPAKSVRGQLVLVTGGSRGIGRAIALEFAKKGANIALWDIIQGQNEETADDIANQTGVTVKAYTCDVTKVDDVKSAAKAVIQSQGHVDILVNNAGVMKVRHLLDLSDSEIRQTMEVNTVSHFWTVREFLPAMLERRSGHIVTTASMAGVVGTPMLVDYCASKFAAVGFSMALSEELRQDYPEAHIPVTIVCPMFTNTNLINDIKHRVKMQTRFDKYLDAEMVAEAVVQGVVREKQMIFVPSHLSSIGITQALIPKEGLEAIGAFLKSRFVPIDKE